MADFPELHESRAHREPSFLRPIDTRTPPGRRHRAARQNHASPCTRLSPTPENPRRPPPPPQPVPIPSPHIKARGIAELNQDLYQYGSNVDREVPDLEAGTMPRPREGSPAPEAHQWSFSGGFMSGLKGLSKYMMRDRSPDRNPDAVLSGYESPGRPGSFYVQASMPVAEPEPAAIRQHHSPSRASKHSHDRNASLDLHDGETTVVHHEPLPNLAEPVTAEPRPSSDYAKMDSPLVDVPANIPLHSRITSIRNFFRELNELPWVATHVAADYIPGQSNSRRRATGRRPVSSWYSHDRHQSLDLLSGESSPTPSTRHRRAFSTIVPVQGPSPGAVYNEGHRPQKISNEPPMGGPRYPHGYVPAPSVRYATPTISVGSVRGHGGTPPVVPVYPRGSREAQYPHSIPRPPTAQTS